MLHVYVHICAKLSFDCPLLCSFVAVRYTLTCNGDTCGFSSGELSVCLVLWVFLSLSHSLTLSLSLSLPSPFLPPSLLPSFSLPPSLTHPIPVVPWNLVSPWIILMYLKLLFVLAFHGCFVRKNHYFPWMTTVFCYDTVLLLWGAITSNGNVSDPCSSIFCLMWSGLCSSIQWSTGLPVDGSNLHVVWIIEFLGNVVMGSKIFCDCTLSSFHKKKFTGVLIIIWYFTYLHVVVVIYCRC